VVEQLKAKASAYERCIDYKGMAMCIRPILELIGQQIFVDVQAPLMEAVHLMAKHHLINVAVMKKGELVGILRGRDIIPLIAPKKSLWSHT
jgi:signal-transduction protein with cAMP-binding, CBS, and nucleotidyltransferase domain